MRLFLLVKGQAGAIPMDIHGSPLEKILGLRALGVALIVVNISAG
jgi:hypothetical protein